MPRLFYKSQFQDQPIPIKDEPGCNMFESNGCARGENLEKLLIRRVGQYVAAPSKRGNRCAEIIDLRAISFVK